MWECRLETELLSFIEVARNEEFHSIASYKAVLRTRPKSALTKCVFGGCPRMYSKKLRLDVLPGTPEPKDAKNTISVRYWFGYHTHVLRIHMYVDGVGLLIKL